MCDCCPRTSSFHGLFSSNMRISRSSNKKICKSQFAKLFLVLSSLIVLCWLLSHSSGGYSSEQWEHEPTRLDHIMFGILAEQKSWTKSKDFVKLWWKPDRMRGCVFFDGMPQMADNSSLPPFCVSEDTSGFRNTHKWKLRSAIRAARIIRELVTLNDTNVRWYVLGDEDTVFFPNNLVKTLSKYDHKLWYYIGANTENFELNRAFGFEMAYFGAGIAISSSLAKVFAKVVDSCIQRYGHLYGGDSRVYSCMTELGIARTHEPGFHQLDLRGDAFGLLAAHPLTPIVSIHNLYSIDPIFPGMSTAKSLEHLFEATTVDSSRIMQQTVCYDRWFSWTVSVSWGYAIQVFPYHIFLPDATVVQETFKPWQGSGGFAEAYRFSTNPIHTDPCKRPTVFFLHTVSSSGNSIETVYKKSYVNCSVDPLSPRKLKEVRVYTHKLELSTDQLRSPRRQCCDPLPSSNNKVLDIAIRECREEELIYMHP